ncbi:MAG: hypothetical protein DDT40_00328 [candidate division WS2 bacterium]|uniref:ChlI/MoxR AAA lid domain-containing protein n=1 Tax=Psychracetigena formicireducens TaxID=2986056 RepID=A0A9E2BLD4_PSYF1|nr:hypothetical protein [Candidatus Psychracetigena formicireducens]MBT9145164.1 hypothetical protein [Candidatus Psychracetigena formicireducens]MBT9150162.1 hypothetical protein [Candidatus Psychracetigena formicireducens]
MATQNPIEQEGTFPLPEAQLDRFMIRLELGYPDARNEQALLTRFAQANPFDRLAPVATAMDLAQLKDETQKVHMGQAVAEYLVNIVQQTRLHKELRLGASPRASLALMRAARALALLEGRTFVLPDDIKRLVKVVLCHRLIIKSQARLRGQTAAEILSQVLEGVPVPVIPGQ